MATKGIKLGSLFVEIGSDLSGYKKGSAAVKGDLVDISGRAQKVGAAMSVMGAATVAALGVATAKASTFNTALAEINTLGVENLGAIREAILEVAQTYGGDLVTNAKAAYQAISAGASEAQVPQLLANAAKAATAGVSDLTTAIELGTSISNAYGKSLDNVNQVYDEAFIAVKNGVTTFGELAASMADVTSVAAPLNVSSAEAFAAVSALTKAGNSTSKSVTRLAAAMAAMLRPSEKAKQVAGALGLEFDAQAIKAKGLAGFLDELGDSLSDKNLTEPKVIKALDELGVSAKDVEGILGELFGSQEAIGAVLTLTGSQAQEFTKTLDEMGTATGATDAALQKFIDANPGQAFVEMKATIAALTVELGEQLLPIAVDFARWLTDAALRMIEFTKTHPAATKGLVILAGALGSLATAAGAVIGLLGTVGVGMIGFSGGAGIASAAAGTLVAALTGPAGFVLAATAAIATIAVLIAELEKLDKAKRTQVQSEKQAAESIEKTWEVLKQRGAIFDEEAVKLMTINEQLQIQSQLNKELIEQEMERAGLAQQKDANAQAEAEALDYMQGLREQQNRALEEHATLTNVEAEAMGQAAQNAAAYAGEVQGAGSNLLTLTNNSKLSQTETKNLTTITNESIPAHQAVAETLRIQSAQFKANTDAVKANTEAKRENAGAGEGSGGSDQSFANGGIVKGYAGGGVIDSMLALVGERGPEIANLPVNTRIHTNAESKRSISEGIRQAITGTAMPGGAFHFHGGINGGILDPVEFMRTAVRDFEHTLGRRLMVEKALTGKQ